MHHSGARSTRRRPRRRRGATPLPPLLSPAPAPVEDKKAPDADTTFKEATRKLKKLLEVEKDTSRKLPRHMRNGRLRGHLWSSRYDAVAVEAESVATRLGGKARTSNAPGAPLDSATLAGFDADDRAQPSKAVAVGRRRPRFPVPERGRRPAPAEHAD